MNEPKETISSRYNINDMCMNSQVLRQHAQSWTGSRLMGCKAWKGEMDLDWVPTLNQEGIYNWQYLAKIFFFSKWVSLGILIKLIGRLHAQKSTTKQNKKLNGINFMSHIALLCHFFIIKLPFCLYIVVL